jgi:FtsH-binding integral membrane protein
MAAGLLLAAATASLMAHTEFHAALHQNALVRPFVWLILLAPLGLVMLSWFGIEEMSFIAAQAIFWAYAALLGFSFGCIFLVYTGLSMAPMFFVAGLTFAAMSLYGHSTGADLSEPGSFLVMGVVGVTLAWLICFALLGSTAMSFAVVLAGVLAFVGLAAWNSERLAAMYFERNGDEVISKKALMGALALYFDANPFALLLRLENLNREG